jgi:hypothetical protein
VTEQEPVGFRRRHAAESVGGDRLADHVVGHVSGGKGSGDTGGRRAWNDFDLASRPHRELTAEQGCRRGMTCCDEDAIGHLCAGKTLRQSEGRVATAALPRRRQRHSRVALIDRGRAVRAG